MAHHVNDVTPSTENYTTPGDATRWEAGLPEPAGAWHHHATAAGR
ncbi:hypothetical protein [Microbacterium sp.]